MGIYKKPRPFNHIFGGDRILRAWYRGTKNAGPRKRAQGRAQDTPYITSYHHITMEFGGYLLNVAKKTTRARARKGEAQGVLSYQKVTGIFDNPHIPATPQSASDFWRVWVTGCLVRRSSWEACTSFFGWPVLTSLLHGSPCGLIHIFGEF